MPGVKLSVTRPTGRALLIGNESCRSESLHLLERLGFQCAYTEDPYSAMVELVRQSQVYDAIVVSLNSFYREELQYIVAVKQIWPEVEVWLTLTDGRAAALAEAMRCGADGLLNEDGWHRTAAVPSTGVAAFVSPISAPKYTPPINGSMASELRGVGKAEPESSPSPVELYLDDSTGEPLLSVEELRALLAEPPATIQAESD